MESCHIEQELTNGAERHLIDRDQLIRDLNKLAPEQFDAVVNAVIMSQPVFNDRAKQGHCKTNSVQKNGLNT